MQINNYIQLMQAQGGSFVRNLAALYLSADPMNRQILLEAFDQYFAIYKERFDALQAAAA